MSNERASSQSTIPLRSKNRKFTNSTHMALRENDNSRLHFVEEIVKTAGRNEYTITHNEETLAR